MMSGVMAATPAGFSVVRCLPVVRHSNQPRHDAILALFCPTGQFEFEKHEVLKNAKS